jgi:hypothetical protein
VWRGIDFGFHYSPVYWAEVQADRVVYVFDELDAQQMTTSDLAPDILARDRTHGLDSRQVKSGVDPAGKARTAQGGTDSDHAVLRQHGIHVQFREPSVPKDRVGLIKRLLKEGRLIIDPVRCPFLVEALEQAEWDMASVPHSDGGEKYAKETYRKDGYYEHPLDALGYLLINVFPPKGRAAGSRSGGPPASAHSYSPSEYG